MMRSHPARALTGLRLREVVVNVGLATFSVPAQAADFTLNVNTVLTVDDPIFKGLESFKANAAARSGGKTEVKLFPGSQLGEASGHQILSFNWFQGQRIC